ncbi:MAG: type transporter [Solirubrobacterales bacterium]|nr:type transporter [Solirubrobacterales bacterium]
MGAMIAGARARGRRTMDVLAELAKSDIKMRYGRGRVRAVKWLLDPIAALGVYLALIVFVLDRGETATGLSLLCAIIPFQLVMMTVINALQAVGLRSSIIVNMAFPRTLIPLSSVLTESVALTASLTLLPIMMAIYGVAPTAALLWLPVAIAVTIAFAAALAYPAALAGIWWPELMPFGVSLVRAMFFLAPGLVALDQITGTARELLPVNPLTGLFESFRDAVLFGHAPAAWKLLVPLAVGALVLAVSLPVYRREQSEFAKLVG